MNSAGGKMAKFVGSIVLVGNGFILLRSLIASMIIIFGLRHEALSGASYHYPKGMLFTAFCATAFLLIFLVAQFFSLREGGWWRWLVMLCLFVFLIVDIYEAGMAHSLNGLTRPILKMYLSAGLFFGWILLNYYYWFVIRKRIMGSK
jgi:hypothetical protein